MQGGPFGHTLSLVKALLLESIHPAAEATLRDAGFEIETRTGSLSESELIEILHDVTVLGIRSNTKVSARVIEAAPESLVAIGAFCIGTNQINLDAATKRGITVFNAPFSNTRSVVELAMAEIVVLARHLTDKNMLMHQGVWDKSATGSHEVRGRTLGIVGYGNIGSQLSVLAEAFGMQVYFYDLVDKLALGNAKRVDNLEELLAKCETISIHIDGRTSNAGFFDAAKFDQMRPRSLFLNLSRGNIVDQVALAENLRTGHLAGAAIDVYPTEPKAAGDQFVSELQGFPNVILTPHIGGSTLEAQVDIGRFVAHKLADFVHSGSTVMSVNLPEVSAPEVVGHRIINLHANVPGVMARLNQLFAERGTNITYQALSTRGQVGFVVTDVSNGVESVLEEMRKMPETIKVWAI